MELLWNILRRPVRPSRWIVAVAAIVFFWLIIYIAIFFSQVNSTLSDATWGDVSYYNQLAYNFTHGRPFQTSLYRFGPAVSDNPLPYLHSFAQHVNFTPYLFLWFYKFMPTVNCLYLLTVLFNVAGFLGIGWLITRRISSDSDRFIFYALSCVMLICPTPFADVITYKGHFALFGGPLILAAYYFCLRNNKFMLVVTGLLLCGISEDMAMFMCSFSAYLFIFEKDMRKTALLTGIVAAAYLAFVFLVVQPASQGGLTLAYTSVVAARINMNYNTRYHHGLFVVALYFIRLAAAFTIMVLFSGLRKEIEWRRPLGLIIIAPASHWFLLLREGPGHHFIPVLVCTFLAFLLITAKLKARPVALLRIATAVFICIAVLLVASHRLLKRCPSYFDSVSIARMKTNKIVLKEVAGLPKEAGVSYWTNRGIDAFMTSRNNVWRFPEYFDSADYLVIQKDADQAFFNMKATGSIEAAIKEGKDYDGTDVAMPVEAVKRIKNELVDIRATHEVIAETGHVLILKRKESAKMPSPGFTAGLSWIKNIGFREKTANAP